PFLTVVPLGTISRIVEAPPKSDVCLRFLIRRFSRLHLTTVCWEDWATPLAVTQTSKLARRTTAVGSSALAEGAFRVRMKQPAPQAAIRAIVANSTSPVRTGP